LYFIADFWVIFGIFCQLFFSFFPAIFCRFLVDFRRILDLLAQIFLPAHPKVEWSGKRLMVCWKIVLKTLERFHEAPHTVAQLYGVPHNTILYENEFQNPQICSPAPKVFAQAFNFK
jgi:hypothetical protein